MHTQHTIPAKRKHYPGHSILGRQSAEVINLTERPPEKRRQFVPNVASRSPPAYINTTHQSNEVIDFTNPLPGHYPLGNVPVALPRTPAGNNVAEQPVAGYPGWQGQAQPLDARQIQMLRTLSGHIEQAPMKATAWQEQAHHTGAEPARAMRPIVFSRTPSGHMVAEQQNFAAGQAPVQNLDVGPMQTSRFKTLSRISSGQSILEQQDSVLWQEHTQHPGVRPIQTAQAHLEHRELLGSVAPAVGQAQDLEQDQMGMRKQGGHQTVQSMQYTPAMPYQNMKLQLSPEFSFDVPASRQLQAQAPSQLTGRVFSQYQTRELRATSGYTNAMVPIQQQTHSPTCTSFQSTKPAYSQQHAWQYAESQHPRPPLSQYVNGETSAFQQPSHPIYSLYSTKKREEDTTVQKADNDCLIIESPEPLSHQEPEREMTLREIDAVLKDWAERVVQVKGQCEGGERGDVAWKWLWES